MARRSEEKSAVGSAGRAGQGSGEERARREGEDRKRGWGGGSGIRRGFGNNIDCGDSQGRLESSLPVAGATCTHLHVPPVNRGCCIQLRLKPFEMTGNCAFRVQAENGFLCG